MLAKTPFSSVNPQIKAFTCSSFFLNGKWLKNICMPSFPKNEDQASIWHPIWYMVLWTSRLCSWVIFDGNAHGTSGLDLPGRFWKPSWPVAHPFQRPAWTKYCNNAFFFKSRVYNWLKNWLISEAVSSSCRWFITLAPHKYSLIWDCSNSIGHQQR